MGFLSLAVLLLNVSAHVLTNEMAPRTNTADFFSCITLNGLEPRRFERNGCLVVPMHSSFEEQLLPNGTRHCPEEDAIVIRASYFEFKGGSRLRIVAIQFWKRGASVIG